MIIHSLRLQNVRKHTDTVFEFSDGVNVIVGPNACGKTTVLEAIALNARGSIPATRVKDVIKTDQPWMRIDMQVENSQRVFKYQPNLLPNKLFEIDADKVKRLKYEQVVPIVWFDPEALRLISGSPGRRREYIDTLLGQLDPRYKLSLGQFNRALAQRNSLLKKHNVPADQFFVWNVRFTEHAKYIVLKRREFVQQLQQNLSAKYQSLSGTKKVINPLYLSNTPAENYGDTLMTQLEASLGRDKMLGHTSYGPHRDDLHMLDVNNRPLAETASRGEVRTLVLALKVIEVECLEAVFKTKPILLFDDVFSELDGARRHAFTDHLKNSQTIITTTDADIVTKNFARSAKLIAL